MCLDRLWPKEQKDKWLKDEPDTIIGYKVVEVRTHSVRPIFQGTKGRYSITNKIRKTQRRSLEDVGERTYRPYYHICVDKNGAEKWHAGWTDRRILKCEIPKKAITEVGVQQGYITIVTKEFTFVEGLEYFKEKNNVLEYPVDKKRN